MNAANNTINHAFMGLGHLDGCKKEALGAGDTGKLFDLGIV